MKIKEGIDSIVLNHKSYSIAQKSVNHDFFMIGNGEKKISILSKEGIIKNEYEFDFEVLSMDFDVKREIISIVDERGLHIYNYEKKTLKNYQGNYKSVLLQSEKIWSIRAESKSKVVLEIYDLENYLLLDSLEIEDIFLSSYYMICEACDENSIILWGAGGQDGQLNYLVKLTADGLKIEEIGEFDTYPVKFSPNKKSFINFGRDFLKIYSYSGFKHRKTIKIDPDIECLMMIIYLDDSQILLQFSDKLTIYNARLDILVNVNIFKTQNEHLQNMKDEIYSCKAFRLIEKLGNRLIVCHLDNEILLVDNKNLIVRNENQLEFKF